MNEFKKKVKENKNTPLNSPLPPGGGEKLYYRGDNNVQ